MYRLYNPVSKKVVISRDVVFAEDEKWEWGRSNDELEVYVLEWGDKEEIRNQDQSEEGMNAENNEVEGRGFNSSSGEWNEEGGLDPVQGRNKREPS